METWRRLGGTAKALCLVLAVLSNGAAGQAVERAYEITEERTPCSEYQPLRRPLFGDLHVHSSYSFDAYASSTRRNPWDAYSYAKGRPIVLPDADGRQSLVAQLARPLDFAAVTDHAEYLGPIDVCSEDAGRLGYWWPHCMATRAGNQWVQLFALDLWTRLAGQQDVASAHSFACTLSDCDAAGAAAWGRIQQAAADHYDRSAACSFTTFVGYEYTDSPERRNMHRNVIFRNAAVTDMPISNYDTGRYNFPKLWQGLRAQCIEGRQGCDVLTIPHNPNLAGGLMFRDPTSPEELRNRLFFEPVVELVQHKGASECRFDRLAGRGLDTEDELCDFEQIASDNLSMLGTVNGVVRTEAAKPVPLEAFARRNLVRNALKDGLAYAQRQGTDPFALGFIGSTDTHSATPGGTDEGDYKGHLGRRDAGFRNLQDHFYANPGGYAVVWAEENSRDAIFSALKRRETYATSGTRPIVRFFAGTDLPDDLCTEEDAIAQAYRHGVPMGGELRASAGPMRLFVEAHKDAGADGLPGIDLQRIQVIKGWADAAGQTHERIFDVAGDAANGAGVNSQTCAPEGAGAARLCAVWQDPTFNAEQPAFYYARVLENPSCRWSTRQCQAADVNPFAANCLAQAEAANQALLAKGVASGDIYGKCCLDPATEPFYAPTIQERAWTSPIWHRP